MIDINTLTINNLEDLKSEIDTIREDLKNMTLKDLRKLRMNIDRKIKKLEQEDKDKIIIDFNTNYTYAIKVDAIDIDCERKNYDCFIGEKLNKYKEDLIEKDSFVMCADFNERNSSRSNYYFFKVEDTKPTLLLEGTGKNLISFIYDCYNIFYNIEEDSIIPELQDS